MTDFDSEYVSVAERIAEFRTRYPAGSLQPADPSQPYQIEHMPDGSTFIAYTAAAYRHPGDPCPGIACAWEPFPGKTDYTAGAELQNAETSAWGRAIVAALVADSRKGVASTEEVVHRRADRRADEIAGKITVAPKPKPASNADRRKLAAAAKRLGIDSAVLPTLYGLRFDQRAPYDEATAAEIAEFREYLIGEDKVTLASVVLSIVKQLEVQATYDVTAARAEAADALADLQPPSGDSEGEASAA